ncbi:MAG: phBC6A51 family helix-turn-helix protein [Minisyncoccota bacterium]
MNEKQRKTVSSRIEKEKEKLLEALRKTPVVQVACERSGVSKATFYRWRAEDVEFLNESEKALTEGKELVGDMAVSQLISLVRDKDFRAIKFWLENHNSDYKKKVEVQGAIKVNQELTAEQKELIEKALTLAGLHKSNDS